MSNMVKDKPNRSEKKLKPPLWKSLLKPKLSPKKYTPEQEQEEEKTERNSSEASFFTAYIVTLPIFHALLGATIIFK